MVPGAMVCESAGMASEWTKAALRTGVGDDVAGSRCKSAGSGGLSKVPSTWVSEKHPISHLQ